MAEIYVPALNRSCILPNLPNKRFYHSQVGLRACGGLKGQRHVGDTCEQTCDTWNPEKGSWASKDVSLIGCRARNSWTTASGEGTYLIGGYGWGSGNGHKGWDNAYTTDLLKPDGTVVSGFNLTTFT